MNIYVFTSMKIDLKSDAWHNYNGFDLKINSVAVLRKRTIPTERLTLVGEVSAILCG
jgi:hypothetical protein